MHTDIHKGAKVGHVGDRAFQDHARLQIVQGFHPFLETGEAEFRTRVAAGLLQFGNDILYRRQPEPFCHVILGIQTTQERGITDDLVHLAVVPGGNRLHHTIGFRVD